LPVLDPPTPGLALVVPFHRIGDEALACLQALARLDPQPDELVLVWDGSAETVPRPSLLSPFAPAWLVTGATRGPARARNLGVDACRSEWVAFVDSDVVASPDLIARMRQIAVRAVNGEGRGFDAAFGSYDDSPPRSGLYSAYRNLFHHFTHQGSDREAATFWAGCGLVRRSAFEAVSGFSETFAHPSIEDIEFGLRLKDGGFRIRLDPALRVRHLKTWRVIDIWRTDVKLRAWPWARVCLERGSMPNDLNLRWRARVSGVLALVAVAVALWSPGVGLVVAAAVSVVNADLHVFMWRRGGPAMLVTSLVAHFAYLVMSSATFAVAVLAHVVSARPDPAAAAARRGQTPRPGIEPR
jgi:GT2 family glycosyltransferase